MSAHPARTRRVPWLSLHAGAAGALVLTAVACGAPPSADAPPRPPATDAAQAAPTFVNRVWRVAESTGVAPGHLYVFLSEGTLVIASPTGTPSLGTWTRDGVGLTMVEDGLAYATDIVSLTADEFRIRSHNPGEPVDTRLVPADRDQSGGAR